MGISRMVPLGWLAKFNEDRWVEPISGQSWVEVHSPYRSFYKKV